jgi:geranylgeranyl pyrophosphate synthase
VLKECSDEVRRAALLEELHVLLRIAALPPGLGGVVLEALAAPGKLLGAPAGSRWPDFVLACCGAAGGRWSTALPAAVAAEFLALALDLLDEIEDDDPSPLRDRYGAPIVVNCSTALLGMAGLAVAHLASRSVPPVRILRCQETMARAVATAAGGQHLDLSAERGFAHSVPLLQGEIQDLVARKSGALVGGCCALGAAVAGADDALLALYWEFGRHIGMAAQFDNDMHDVWAAVVAGDAEYPLVGRTPPSAAALATPGGPQLEGSDSQGAWKTTQDEVPPSQRSAQQNPSGVLDEALGATLRPGRAKSDLRRGKQTVPLAFLRDTPGGVQPRQHEALAEQLWETGALPYAWALVQVHREKAREVLARIDGAGAEPGLALSALGDLIGATTAPPPISAATSEAARADVPQDGGAAR